MMNNMNACKMAHEIKKATGCDLSTAFKAAYKAIKAANTKTTFTKADIDKIYTEIVTKYISKGYIIRTSDMNGSQGEMAYIDVTNGTDVIRILMEKKTDYRSCSMYNKKIVITVGLSDVKNNENRTIWNNHLTPIEEMSWFVVDDDTWFVTEEEIKAINEKADARAEVRWEMRKLAHSEHEHVHTSAAAVELVLAWVNKQKGFKTAKASDITYIVRKGTKVIIEVKGKTLILGK